MLDKETSYVNLIKNQLRCKVIKITNKLFTKFFCLKKYILIINLIDLKIDLKMLQILQEKKRFIYSSKILDNLLRVKIKK